MADDRKRNQLIAYFLDLALTTKCEAQAENAIKNANQLVKEAQK